MPAMGCAVNQHTKWRRARDFSSIRALKHLKVPPGCDLSGISLEVFNSGNQAVLIRLDNNAKIVRYSIKTEPEVGFGKISELLRQNGELDLSIELLNPGDRVYLELISVNNTSDLIEVYMKNANVICRSYTRKAAESAILGVLNKSVDPTLVSLAMMRSIPLFDALNSTLWRLSRAIYDCCFGRAI